jgi:ribosome biogenesis GTPase / thiamine phosphate phosphatase
VGLDAGAGQLRTLDEDDIRVRAGRGSRPRTRRRPAHSDAVDAFVVSVDRGRYGCLVSDSVITAMKARELGRGSVVVGDRVALAGDSSGAPGSLARIVRVYPRSSELRRSADDTDPVERVIVANADQLVIVSSLASPPPRFGFIDRCLVAAYDAGLSPLLVLTKGDLGSARKVRALYAPLDIPMITTRQPLPARTLGSLRSALAGRLNVLIGQSGVGKSTLVNSLIPSASRAVGSVNPVTGRGRHTSSSAVALSLPATRGHSPGWLIDTPGVRSFGLGHVSTDRVVEAFGDLPAEDCPPGCDHLGPDCALSAWASEHGATARLNSLRRLLTSLSSTPDP